MLREGRGEPTELRGFLNYGGLKAFQKCDNFGGLRPTQESLALAGAEGAGPWASRLDLEQEGRSLTVGG